VFARAELSCIKPQVGEAKQQWRVAYALLHRVVDGSAASGELLELDILPAPIDSAANE
jgi:hypothetical protein